MNIEEIKKENVEVHFKITIDSNTLENEYNKELESIAKNAKIPGFRHGKVPTNIIASKYGKSIYNEVSSKAVNKSIENLFEEKKITPAMQPKIDSLKKEMGHDLEFVLKVELIPEIIMPDFKQLNIEKHSLDISSQDVEAELAELAENHPNYKASKGKAADGDKVIINFVGKIDGTEFENGSAKDFTLILGKKSMIPGFEEQIVGHKVSDSFTIKVTFPKEYHSAKCAGKDAEFEITINELFKPAKQEINDDFAKNVFKLKDLNELKDKVKNNLSENYLKQIETIEKMKLFDMLENELGFDIPPTLLKNEIDSIKFQTEKDDGFKEATEKKSEQEISDYYTKIAKRRVRIALLISDYAKKNNISVSSDEVNKQLLEKAKSMPGYEKAIIDFYNKNPQATQEIVGTILEDKVVKQIINTELNSKEKLITISQLNTLIDKENNKKLSI